MTIILPIHTGKMGHTYNSTHRQLRFLWTSKGLLKPSLADPVERMAREYSDRSPTIL